ncbi:MAG: ATP-dependent zinc metalloprotease FtsH, partial [Ruminococcus sp.]|nr:ATP-dependent zinc metalloprotease FtsH [Ruminococcus sp.]
IDNEIRSIIENAYEKAESLLREHIDQLHLVAKYLMKFEKIDGNDFEKLMSGELTEAEFMNDSDASETNEASENVE